MFRKGVLLPFLLPAATIVASTAPAGAERPRTGFVMVDPVLDLAPEAVESSHISNILFVNRCPGGCTITPGPNDARYNTSSIVSTTSVLSEFVHGDAAFNAVIDCVREVYAPYNVVVTTDDPGDTVFHHEAILAGHPNELGLPSGVGGIAPAACTPLNNVISFSFANLGNGDVEDMCWTVAQESAHSFGLPNHVFDCLDPMTYIPGCGRKYFRNKGLPCGEFSIQPCNCGGSVQNSHAQLRSTFGDGVQPPPPEVEILLPNEGSMVQDGFSIYASAIDPRLVENVQLYINGTRYADVAGYGYARRLDSYFFAAPNLPDGYLDIEIRAQNDLHGEGRTTLRVLKGAPCTSADTCFDNQECVDGACRYPPPPGKLGDRCDFDQYCESGLCPSVSGDRACSQFCNPGLIGSCPQGFDCLAAEGTGICWPEGGFGGGGCCSVAGDERFPWGGALLFGLVALALGFGSRRR